MKLVLSTSARLFSLVALTSALTIACGGGSNSPTGGDGDGDDSTEEADDEEKDPTEKDPDTTEADKKGTGGSGMGGSGPDASGTGGTTSEEPEAPVIVSSTVLDGDTGVLPDSTIVLAFNVPIDSDSFEASYASLELDAENVTFTWNEAGTEVTITPNAPLLYTAGDSLETIEPAIEYSLQLGKGLLSRDGEELEADYSITFSTARNMQSYIDADGTLNGHVRSNGTFQDGGTPVFVGDSGVQDPIGDSQYIGVLSFPITAIDSALAIDTAVIIVAQSVFSNVPSGLAETATVHNIDIESRTWATVSPQITEENEIGLLLSNELVGRSLEVTEAVAGDLGENPVTTFGLSLSTPRDNDGKPDTFEYTNAQLVVTYWID